MVIGDKGSLKAAAGDYHYFGLQRHPDGWVFREWAPNAQAIYLVGTFNAWREDRAYALRPVADRDGVWEIRLPQIA
jgi:1,4-alpha-glucan branching enzyme